MSQLNFNIIPAAKRLQGRGFNPRDQVSLQSWSRCWTMLAITAVMVTTFLAVWYL